LLSPPSPSAAAARISGTDETRKSSQDNGVIEAYGKVSTLVVATKTKGESAIGGHDADAQVSD
jgi:hypothetical protein